MLQKANSFVNCFIFLGYDVKDVGVIVADVSDESSLNAMCSSADIILNCVGPVSRKKNFMYTLSFKPGFH